MCTLAFDCSLTAAYQYYLSLFGFAHKVSGAAKNAELRAVVVYAQKQRLNDTCIAVADARKASLMTCRGLLDQRLLAAHNKFRSNVRQYMWLALHLRMRCRLKVPVRISGMGFDLDRSSRWNEVWKQNLLVQARESKPFAAGICKFYTGNLPGKCALASRYAYQIFRGSKLLLLPSAVSCHQFTLPSLSDRHPGTGSDLLSLIAEKFASRLEVGAQHGTRDDGALLCLTWQCP